MKTPKAVKAVSESISTKGIKSIITYMLAKGETEEAMELYRYYSQNGRLI